MLCTWNIWSMLVTFETSQASGWLKLYAFCRARRGAVGSRRRDQSSVVGVASGKRCGGRQRCTHRTSGMCW